MNQFDCILPAAGLSRRMGAWKLGLAWRGRSLLEWSVSNALAACRRVLVVTGCRAAELEALLRANAELADALAAGRLRIVLNEDYRRGLVSSVRTGARLVESECFFVAPADMPRLSPSLYAAVAAARAELADQADRPAAVRPFHLGRPGHPVLFDASALAVIAELPDGESLKTVFEFCDLRSFETVESASVFDVDEPGDLKYTGA